MKQYTLTEEEIIELADHLVDTVDPTGNTVLTQAAYKIISSAEILATRALMEIAEGSAEDDDPFKGIDPSKITKH